MTGTANDLHDPDHDMAIRKPFRRAPSMGDVVAAVAIIAMFGGFVLWSGWLLLGVLAGWVE